MRKRIVKRFSVFLLILCLLLTTGCGGGEDSGGASGEDSGQARTGEAAAEKNMVIGDTTFNAENWEETVDPHRTYNGWACIRYGVGETLVRYTDNMELEPWLAKSWENDGGLVWTITLQDNVTFSSGRAMDAEVGVGREVAHDGAGRGVNEGDEVSSYAKALQEVKSGCKRTHWIWYIFPQMAGIKGTHSRPALFYGINGRLEAYQYINHPVLRRHLVEITEAVLNSKYSAYEIFGDDIIKFRSSILLFDSVSDIPVFRQIKNKYRWQ